MTKGRIVIIPLLIACMALAGVARKWAWDQRDSITADPLAQSLPTNSNRRQYASAGLADMNSYALCLLLGGLRGPLVMFLWSSSESQKTEHDLEDFDTKVEWIRLLQPEFDTVHLFEIWNKAYNISVQMANLPNKYSSIIGALDYADKVDAQRPDDINIIYTIGMTYGDKLGGIQLPLAERQYYLRRTCDDTRWPQALTRVTLPVNELDAFLAAARDAGMDRPADEPVTDDSGTHAIVTLAASIVDPIRSKFPDAQYQEIMPRSISTNPLVERTRLDPMLDAEGNLLPSEVAPTHPRPDGLAADVAWYDGSRLQALKEFEPFPYGLSPSALSYNYYKRAQYLERLYHEEHIQTSDFVVDSRPSLALKAWGTAEGEAGRRAELRLFGLDDTGDRLTLEVRAPAANPAAPFDPASLTKLPDPAAGVRALNSYGMAARVFRIDHAEYLDHEKLFPRSLDTFASHVDDTIAFEALYQADHDFLAGLLVPTQRELALRNAFHEYELARQALDEIIFRFYTNDEIAELVFPVNPATGERLNRLNIGNPNLFPPEKRDQLLADLLHTNAQFYKNHFDQFTDDRNEYLNYISRTEERDRVIQAMLSATKAAAPPDGNLAEVIHRD